MIITLANGNTYNVEPSDDSNRYAELMGDDYVVLKFSTADYIEIAQGSSIVFNGSTYYVFKPQEVRIVNSRNFEYTVRFDLAISLWHYRPFVNPDDNRVTFTVTGTLNDHVTMLIRSSNINTDITWTEGDVDSDDLEKSISYDSVTLWDAIVLLCNEFDTEFEFIGYALHVKKIEYNSNTPLVVKYGKGNGVNPGIKRTNYGDSQQVAALYVKGGVKNININEYKSVVWNQYANSLAGYDVSTSLHMPSYIDGYYNGNFHIDELYFKIRIGFDGEYLSIADRVAKVGNEFQYVYRNDGQNNNFDLNKAKYYEISFGGRYIYPIETPGYADYRIATPNDESTFANELWHKIDIVDLSEIYPQRTHTVTAVESQIKYDEDNQPFLEYTISFSESTINYDEALIPGNKISIVFQSGELTGKEFDVNYQYIVSQHPTRKFTIVSKIIDDVRMPGDAFIPEVGDTFRVFNVMLPQMYMRDSVIHNSPYYVTFEGAEWEMAKRAVKMLWESQNNIHTWTFDIDGIYAASLSSSDFAKLKIGGYVSFSDDSVHPGDILIRIIGIKQPINHPKWMSLSLADKATNRNGLYITSLRSHSNASLITSTIARDVGNEGNRRVNDNVEESIRIKAAESNITTIGGRVTNVEKSVSDMHDNYNELRDSSEGIDVEGAVCAKMYNIVLSIDNSRRTFYIDSKFAGVETSVMITNSSSTDIEIIPVSKTDSVIFNMADKNNTLVSGGVCKLTFYYTNRLYYVYITNIISSVK